MTLNKEALELRDLHDSEGRPLCLSYKTAETIINAGYHNYTHIELNRVLEKALELCAIDRLRQMGYPECDITYLAKEISIPEFIEKAKITMEASK